MPPVTKRMLRTTSAPTTHGAPSERPLNRSRPGGTISAAGCPASSLLVTEQPLQIRAMPGEHDGDDARESGDAPRWRHRYRDEECDGGARKRSDAGDAQELVADDPRRGAAEGGKRRDGERDAKARRDALASAKS